jgi:HTH-like domain
LALGRNSYPTLTRSERLATIERLDSELALSEQADLLSIRRSSLYYRPAPPSPEEVMIKHLIDEIYTARPFCGSRRLMVALREKGFSIVRKTVQRYMHEMGITAVSRTQSEPPGLAASGLSVLASQCRRCTSQPHLGHRSHVHSPARELDVLIAIIDSFSPR